MLVQMLRAISPYSALCEELLQSYDGKQACPWLTRTDSHADVDHHSDNLAVFSINVCSLPVHSPDESQSITVLIDKCNRCPASGQTH